VFGDGPNFVRTMLKLAGDRDELAVVNDQLGRPTYAPDLAAALIGLLERGAPGTYHFSNNGDIVSWAEFAKTIFEVSGSSCKVTPISTAQYLEGKTGIAPRPAYSALDLSKTEIAGVSARDWRAALKDYLTKENAS
jgi:dTDP-4-dehydrorhamnose reductase